MDLANNITLLQKRCKVGYFKGTNLCLRDKSVETFLSTINRSLIHGGKPVQCTYLVVKQI
jgi:hypothetical protein